MPRIFDRYRFVVFKFGFIFAFPMRCHPQADAGDREAVDEESKLRFGIGYDFSWRIKGFTYTPACKFKPALLIRHFVTPSPLGKASNEETHR